MTEEQFNAAINNGQVNKVEPLPALPLPVSPADSQPGEKLSDFIQVLQVLRSPKPALSAPPTFTPKSFADSIQWVDDGVTKTPYFYINGQWVAPVPSNAMPIYWPTGDNLIGGNTTAYIGINAIGSDETVVPTVMPVAGTITKLYAQTFTAQPASGNSVLTVRKNNADQSVTLTIAANASAGLFSDLTHSFSVAAGDLVDVKWVNNATTNACKIHYVAFVFIPA
jgi:hypothetical protein